MIDSNSQFFAILTAVGEAKQANATALGIPWTFKEMGVGDANNTDPIPNRLQTRLINEWRRAPVNQVRTDPANPNIIITEQVIPADVGGQWIRELALYDADGDMVAVANCAPSFKPLLAQGTGKTQIIRMNFIVANTAQIVLKIDPAVVLATREYVDVSIVEALSRMDFKHSVLVATTANIVLNGAQTIDAVAVVAGDRVLVKNQALAKDNGLYVVPASGAWKRAQDADVSVEVTPGLFVHVEKGTANGDSVWQLVTDAPIVLGTTDLVFEMVAGRTGVSAGSYTNVTVDKNGRVIAGTNPTTLAGHGITDAFTKAEAAASDQSQAATAFTTTGVSGSVFTLTPVPAIRSYEPDQRFRVKFHMAGAETPGINISGQGIKLLKQYDSSGAKVSAVIASGQLADVEYDGTSVVLLDPLPSASVLPYNYFSGFVLANNATAPTTTLDVAPGAARDTTDTVNLKLPGTLRGILQAAGGWAVGDNQNKLDTGVKAINAWYHVFVIRRTSNGTVDILFSLSPTAPTLPDGYAGFKRISSIRTDASGSIIPFFNVGRRFTWLTPIMDLTASVATAALFTLSVPTGVPVMARFWVAVYGAGDSGVVYTSPSANSITYAGTTAAYSGGVGISTTSGDQSCSGAECIAENAQVRFHGYATARVLTYGWEEVA